MAKYYVISGTDELHHSGTKGMHWHERLYQYEDGSLTPLGRIHYGVGQARKKVDVLKKKVKAVKVKRDKEKAKKEKENEEKRAAEEKVRMEKAAAKAKKESEEAAIESEKAKAFTEKAKAEQDRLEAQKKLDDAIKNSKADEKNSNTYKKIDEMTDAELKSYIERLNNEKQVLTLRKEISSLTAAQVNPGVKFIKSVGKVAGKAVSDVVGPAVTQLGKEYLIKMGKEALGLNEQNTNSTLRSLQRTYDEAKLRADIAKMESDASIFRNKKRANDENYDNWNSDQVAKYSENKNNNNNDQQKKDKNKNKNEN